jgi:hypothetical protein
MHYSHCKIELKAAKLPSYGLYVCVVFVRTVYDMHVLSTDALRQFC